MAMTPEKREALTLAREMVRDEREIFICGALITIQQKHPTLYDACMKLRRYIMRQLGKHHYLSQWQRGNGFPARSLAQLRRDRLAWIDWMLDESKEA